MRDRSYWFFILGFALSILSVVYIVSWAMTDIETGELIDSYALENGAVIIVAETQSQLVVVYVGPGGERDDLRRIELDGEIDSILTEVCGGRLHLTYSVGNEILHQAVDVPSADYGFLPLVCRDAE